MRIFSILLIWFLSHIMIWIAKNSFWRFMTKIWIYHYWVIWMSEQEIFSCIWDYSTLENEERACVILIAHQFIQFLSNKGSNWSTVKKGCDLKRLFIKACAVKETKFYSFLFGEKQKWSLSKSGGLRQRPQWPN